MQKRDSKGLLRTFFSYFKPHKKLFFLDIGCALLVALIDLLYPLVSRNAMYQMLPNAQYRTFFTVMLIVCAAYVLRSVLYYVIWYRGHTFGVRVEADIRRDLYLHIQTLGFDFFDHHRTGQLMSRLTSDLFELSELAHHGPEDLVISIVTLSGALIVMFSIQWRLALVVALILPVFFLTAVRQRKAMRAASGQVKRKIAEINEQVESGLSGVRTAKAFANEALEREKFSRSNDAFRGAKREFHRAMARFNSTIEFFLSMLSVAVIGVGGFLIMQGQIDYIDLITFSLYITTFVNPMRRMANFSELFASGIAGLQRFDEIMKTQPSVRDAQDAVTMQKARGEIDLQHVAFAYDGDLDVLHDVNLQIRAGQMVAVVGPSGGGKTTLCQLIPRFYDVTGGAIRIDGVDVRQLAQHSLRQQIGIVQQDVFLFADSILENIRYGRPDATDAEVEEAAKRAEIYEDIQAMPDGFQTFVGERGTLLSGGQKQRVAIARIFLKNPPILILDEATSALDSVTEAKIQRALDALAQGRTTLVIAHRLSTIRNADRIVVIADGAIQESGSHAQLLKQDGIYAALYRTQYGTAPA